MGKIGDVRATRIVLIVAGISLAFLLIEHPCQSFDKMCTTVKCEESDSKKVYEDCGPNEKLVI